MPSFRIKDHLAQLVDRVFFYLCMYSVECWHGLADQRGPCNEGSRHGRRASDGINDHVFLIKASFQIGAYQMRFDVRRDTLHHVYMLKKNYAWMNIAAAFNLDFWCAEVPASRVKEHLTQLVDRGFYLFMFSVQWLHGVAGRRGPLGWSQSPW